MEIGAFNMIDFKEVKQLWVRATMLSSLSRTPRAHQLMTCFFPSFFYVINVVYKPFLCLGLVEIASWVIYHTIIELKYSNR